MGLTHHNVADYAIKIVSFILFKTVKADEIADKITEWLRDSIQLVSSYNTILRKQSVKFWKYKIFAVLKFYSQSGISLFADD